MIQEYFWNMFYLFFNIVLSHIYNGNQLVYVVRNIDEKILGLLIYLKNIYIIMYIDISCEKLPNEPKRTLLFCVSNFK